MAPARIRPAVDKSTPFFIALPPWAKWVAGGRLRPRRLLGTDYGNISAERVEPLSARGDGLRVDERERDDAGNLAAVDPVVHRAALDEDIARLEVDLVALLELHVDLARDHHGVVDRVGA